MFWGDSPVVSTGVERLAYSTVKETTYERSNYRIGAGLSSPEVTGDRAVK